MSTQRVLIISQPKCGSTAIYYKLKQALPPECQCFFEPPSVQDIRQGLDTALPALAKVLLPPWSEGFDPTAFDGRPEFEKVILLYRDPRDFMISAYLYSFFESFTAANPLTASRALGVLRAKEQKPDQFSFLQLIAAKNGLERGDHIDVRDMPVPVWMDKYGNELDLKIHPLQAVKSTLAQQIKDITERDLQYKGFLGYILDSMKGMVQVHKHYAQQSENVFWLSYEDMVQGRLEGLEAFLGLQLERETTVDAQHQRVVRTKNSGDWINWLLEEDVAFLKPLFQEFMELFGYTDDWPLPETRTITSDVASRYVYKLFKQRASRTNLDLEEDGMLKLSELLTRDSSEEEAYVPGFKVIKTGLEGSDDVHIEDPHFETLDGQRVNVLVPTHTYQYVYRVKFDQPFQGICFWMQIVNHNDRALVKANSYETGQRIEHVEAGDVYEVRFPVLCELHRGFYFCHSGITHEADGETVPLHRETQVTVVMVRKVFRAVRPNINKISAPEIST